MNRIILTTLLIILSALALDAGVITDYGLRVLSTPSLEKDPTSLSLDEGESVSLRRKPLHLSFSLYNSKERPFGCVLRMISDDGVSVDVMNVVDEKGSYRPQIVAGDEYAVVPADIVWDDWVDITVCVEPKRGGVSMNYNGTIVTLESRKLASVKGFRIAFGNCPFKGFTVTSVASVCLRDIILKSGDKIIRHWPLLEHSDIASYDTVTGARALAVNPEWIADQAISLRSVFSEKFPLFVDVVYAGRGVFYIVRSDGDVVMTDLESRESRTIVSKGGCNPSNSPNQSKWCGDGRILSYCIAQNIYGGFDLKNGIWNNDAKSDAGEVYWNVSSSWDRQRSSLYSFGGYGFHHFSNILRVYSPDNPLRSHMVTLDKIAPRFYSSSMIKDDSLFIFGGEGSLSGNQGISEEYFYDLHKVNLDTYEETLVWSAQEPSFGRFIPGENMIYDAAEGCFYTTAIVEKDFVLIRIDEEGKSIEQVSLPSGVRESLPVQYTNLYEDGESGKYYALFIQATVDGETKVDIMSISGPLCPVDSVVVSDSDETRKSGMPVWAIALLAFVAFVLAAAAIVFAAVASLRRHPRGAAILTDAPAMEEHYDFSKNSICLTGAFSVCNRDGEDITSQFSPTLRKLLAILILYSVRDRQGIIGEKLNQMIWDYKPEGTASNNRNVYISRLRTVLEGLDGVRINTKNKYLSITLSDEVTCDYKEAMGLFAENYSKKNVSRLLSLLFRGRLLPNLENDWVESFRNEYSAMALSFLNNLLDKEDVSAGMKLRVAESISQHDRLNERALRVRCSIWQTGGNLSQAKAVYDSYCREYRQIMGEDYKIPFCHPEPSEGSKSKISKL